MKVRKWQNHMTWNKDFHQISDGVIDLPRFAQQTLFLQQRADLGQDGQTQVETIDKMSEVENRKR